MANKKRTSLILNIKDGNIEVEDVFCNYELRKIFKNPKKKDIKLKWKEKILKVMDTSRE